MKKKAYLFLIVALVPCFCIAQSGKTEMADLMRSNGKIYVVIAVILTILAGLILYIIRVDNKIAKLEKGILS